MTARWLAIVALLLGLAPAGQGIPAETVDSLLVATEEGRYALEGPSSLLLPTDVAVDAGGYVYVVDTAGDRVLRFPPSGGPAVPITEVAGLPLQGPTAVALTARGDLWICERDRAAVAVIPAADGDAHRIELPPDLTEEDLDPTDLAVSPDGTQLWIADNDHHRILHADLVRGEWSQLGALGGARGQLRYPYAIALGPRGGIYVTDVLNGRVQPFTADGEPTQAIGRYGVEPGQLYRPKGVACSDRGVVWVTDSVLGVVQAFDERGRLLGVLRDERGEVLHLDTPTGVAIAGDRLFVVESRPGHVRRLKIARRPGTPLRAMAPGIAGATGAQGRECTVCHLEMVPILARGAATALTSPPPSTAEQPWASREESCLSCHDGGVVDSRTQVWSLHGHLRDEEPPAEMEVPGSLPLAGGRIACRTCHSAHSEGGSGQSCRDVLFLRVSSEADELCAQCHPARPGHPAGVVAATSGSAAAGVDHVACLDCHAAHGSQARALLAGDGEPCIACHTAQAGFHSGQQHPRGVPVRDPEAVRRLAQAGGVLGAGDTVVCSSCHAAHGEERGAEARCSTCHPVHVARAGDAGRGHGGDSCLACHEVHPGGGRAAADRDRSDGDPTGCLTCHRPGARSDVPIDPAAGHTLFADNPAPDVLPSVGAEGVLAAGVTGSMGCLTCHVTHVPDIESNPAMLRFAGDDDPTCAACHPDEATVLGSDHDLRGSDEVDGGQGACLTCHGMHDDRARHGYDGPIDPVAVESTATWSCLGCHQPSNPAGGTEILAWEHPQDLHLTTANLPWYNTGELPLYDILGHPTDATEIGTITCLTCHDPHRWDPKHGVAATGEGDIRSSFLRDGWEGFCAGCHGEEALQAYQSFHDPAYRDAQRSLLEERSWPIYSP